MQLRPKRLLLSGVIGLGALALVGLWLTQLTGVWADRRAAPLVVTGPTVVSYQGRVLAGGLPVNGTGYFKFAVVNGAGDVTYWANDGTSVAGGEPAAAVPLLVSNGLFTVLLGDTTQAGMTTALNASVFAGADRRLRVWFSTTNSNFELLAPDQVIGAAPFALNAETLDGVDSADFVLDSELTATVAGAGFITQAEADARYARNRPTAQQIAQLKWYTALSTTQSSFPVAVSSEGIAFDGENIWVTEYSNADVRVFRARDGAAVATYTVGLPAASPHGIAFDGVNMWIANGESGSNTVSVLQAATGALVMTATVNYDPQAVAFDGSQIWVANFGDGAGNTVSVLNASTGATVRTVTVGFSPRALAFDGQHMWVANSQDGTLSVIDAPTGTSVMTITLTPDVRGLAFDGDKMWVVRNDLNSVTAIRVTDKTVLGTYPVGFNPWGVAFDGAYIWVSNFGDGSMANDSVTVLRASDGALVDTVPVGDSPTAMAFDGAFMWIVNAGGSLNKR